MYPKLTAIASSLPTPLFICVLFAPEARRPHVSRPGSNLEAGLKQRRLHTATSPWPRTFGKGQKEGSQVGELFGS